MKEAHLSAHLTQNTGAIGRVSFLAPFNLDHKAPHYFTHFVLQVITGCVLRDSLQNALRLSQLKHLFSDSAKPKLIRRQIALEN